MPILSYWSVNSIIYVLVHLPIDVGYENYKLIPSISHPVQFGE